MKVLVTGATGFIGSHLVEKFLKQGYDITCLTRGVSSSSWLEGLDVNLIEGDCSNKDSLYEYVNGYNYIFHLSGLTKTNSKGDFYEVNTKGAENIINAVVIR